MNHHRAIDSITDEISEIREKTRKAIDKLEDAMSEIDDLRSHDEIYESGKPERWIYLHQRLAMLRDDIRIAENKRLKPLQAEYNRAWNDKWR